MQTFYIYIMYIYKLHHLEITGLWLEGWQEPGGGEEKQQSAGGSLPRVHAPLSRGARHEGDEASAAEDGAHEGVVEPAPVMVHGVRRRGQQHAEPAGRARDALAPGFYLVALLLSQERQEEGLGAARVWGDAVLALHPRGEKQGRQWLGQKAEHLVCKILRLRGRGSAEARGLPCGMEHSPSCWRGRQLWCWWSWMRCPGVGYGRRLRTIIQLKHKIIIILHIIKKSWFRRTQMTIQRSSNVELDVIQNCFWAWNIFTESGSGRWVCPDDED